MRVSADITSYRQHPIALCRKIDTSARAASIGYVWGLFPLGELRRNSSLPDIFSPTELKLPLTCVLNSVILVLAYPKKRLPPLEAE